MQQRGVLQLRRLALVLQRLHAPPLRAHFIASLPISRLFKSRATQSLGVIINAPCLLSQQLSRPIRPLSRARCSPPRTVSTTFTRSLSSGLGSGGGPPFNFNSLKIKAMDALLGAGVSFVVNRTFKWIKSMPKLSHKMQRLQHVFPDFGGYDEFIKGCGQAMEALHVLSNERDVVGARVCMTDAMFDMWQQAIAAAQSEDHSVDITQCKVLNACVVNVAIDETKPLAYVDVLFHATETKIITFADDRAHSKSRKIFKHSPFVFRILRFRSEGAALDWKLDAVGPPGAPPQQKKSSS